MKQKVKESDLHKAFYAEMLYYPKIHPYLFKIEHGIPYGTDKRRNFALAAFLKKTGVKGGILDYHLLLPNKSHSSMYIEFKVGKNKLTQAQEDFIKLATECNHLCVCVWSVDDGVNLVKDYVANKI